MLDFSLIQFILIHEKQTDFTLDENKMTVFGAINELSQKLNVTKLEEFGIISCHVTTDNIGYKYQWTNFGRAVIKKIIDDFQKGQK